MRFIPFVLALCTLLVACAPEAPPSRSTRRPDAGDGDNGDGDGDGDPGDGDGDGDGDSPGVGFMELDRKLVPLPEGATLRNEFGSPNTDLIHLSDDGHVLLAAFLESEGTSVPFIWRGGSAPPERVQLPAEYADASPVCLVDGEDLIVSYQDESTLQKPVRIDGLNATVYEVPAIVSDDDFCVIEYCNGVGQVLARTAGGTWLLGSGPPVRMADTTAEPLGFNDSGDALFRDGYWDGMSFVEMLGEKFKPYSGPSNAGVMLGTYDERNQTKDIAAFWNPSTGKVDQLLSLPTVDKDPVGPMYMAMNGDAIVGTSIKSSPNAVYIYRNGRFGDLGVEDESIGWVVSVNAKGHVLTTLGPNTQDNDHVGIIFSVKD